MSKVHFARNPTRTEVVGKRTHSDHKGDMVPAIVTKHTGGYLYYDEGSGVVLFIGTATKSAREQLIAFKMWCIRMGCKPQEFHSDGGGEYTSELFQEYLRDNGIKFSSSCAHTPQQNSIIERKIRTIWDKVFATLVRAQLSNIFWEECVMFVMLRYGESRTSQMHAVVGGCFRDDISLSRGGPARAGGERVV